MSRKWKCIDLHSIDEVAERENWTLGKVYEENSWGGLVDDDHENRISIETIKLCQIEYPIFEEITAKAPHKHYFKQVKLNKDGKIDVYSVLDSFEVKQSAIQHAIKKLLVGGSRGIKDTRQDYSEAIDSINRAIEMLD